MKAILAALLLCLSLPVWSMSVMPMGQTLEANASVGTLRIHNNSKGAKRYQIVVDALTVDANGQRITTPSSDLTFYPASVFTLKPGATQTVRWKRNTPTSTQEKAYQVIISETPLDSADAVPSGAGMNLTVAPRMINPWVFVPLGAKPALSAHREAGNLVIHNTGSATAPLVGMSYGGKELPGVYLVLPGERLKLPTKATGSKIQFSSRGVAQTLAVE